jgi:hypothetical protein
MKYKVEWIINGEVIVDAASKEDAEQAAQQLLVATLTDADRWPAELGALGIQGAASLIDGELVG